MIVYGTPQEVEEYFADGSANQSYLKKLLQGVDFLGEKEEVLYYKEKGHFLIGSAVDAWLTQGKTNYDNKYYTSAEEKPSPAIMSMVKMIFDNNVVDGEPTGGFLTDFPEEILSSLDFHKYQMRWKEQTRIDKIVNEGKTYFEELKESYGKQIVSATESDLVYNIIMSLLSSKATAGYFKDAIDIDIYYQVPIYFEFEGTPCKVLLDMVRVDRKNGTLEPIDIKTMGDNTINFPWAVKSRGYNFQGAFYTEGLKAISEGLVSCPKIITNTVGYDILPFKFIVETTKTEVNSLTDEVRYFTGKPLVFMLSGTQMHLGKYGRPELEVPARAVKQGTLDSENPVFPVYPINYKQIYGFIDALNLNNWHIEHGFEYDKKVVESGGIIIVE